MLHCIAHIAWEPLLASCSKACGDRLQLRTHSSRAMQAGHAHQDDCRGAVCMLAEHVASERIARAKSWASSCKRGAAFAFRMHDDAWGCRRVGSKGRPPQAHSFKRVHIQNNHMFAVSIVAEQPCALAPEAKRADTHVHVHPPVPGPQVQGALRRQQSSLDHCIQPPNHFNSAGECSLRGGATHRAAMRTAVGRCSGSVAATGGRPGADSGPPSCSHRSGPLPSAPRRALGLYGRRLALRDGEAGRRRVALAAADGGADDWPLVSSGRAPGSRRRQRKPEWVR